MKRLLRSSYLSIILFVLLGQGSLRAQCNECEQAIFSYDAVLNGTVSIIFNGVTVHRVKGKGTVGEGNSVQGVFRATVPPPESSTTVTLAWTSSGNELTEHGITITGCGLEFTNEQNPTNDDDWGVGRIGGGANGFIGKVRRPKDTSESNAPGAGGMPTIGDPIPKDHDTGTNPHPPGHAGAKINLGGKAGSITFGGDLLTGGLMHDRDNINFYSSTGSSETYEDVYEVNGQIEKILSKNDSGVVAFIGFEDIYGGYRVTIGQPGVTTGTGPNWTVATKWVTYEVVSLSNTGDYDYAVEVKRIIGDPNSPSQTTTNRYRGAQNTTLAHYEHEMELANGKVILDRTHSQISGGVRTVESWRIEKPSTSSATKTNINHTKTEYVWTTLTGEVISNEKRYIDTSGNHLETIYSYYTSGRHEDKLKSVEEKLGTVTTGWRMYAYNPTLGSWDNEIIEFSPYADSHTTMPSSVPSITGTFSGIKRVSTYLWNLGRKTQELASVKEYANDELISETTYSRVKEQPDPLGGSVDVDKVTRVVRTSSTKTLTYVDYSYPSYFETAVPRWKAGKIRQTVHPDGSETNYDYSRNSTTEESVSWRTANGSEVSGKSVRNTTRTDLATGRIVDREMEVYIGMAWEQATITTYSYDPDYGILNERKKDGFVEQTQANLTIGGDPANASIAYPYNYPLDRNSQSIEATGVTTLTEYDTAGRVLKVMKKGTPNGYYNQSARQDLVTTYDYASVTGGGLKTTVTISGDGDTVTTSSTTDVAGRVVSSVDQEGSTTTYAYTASATDPWSTETITHPGPITEITDTYPDGRVYRRHGTGQEHAAFRYEATSNGLETTLFQGTTTTPVNKAGYRYVTTGTDLNGRTRFEERPGPGSSTIRTDYTYITDGGYGTGQLYKTSQAGTTILAPKYRDYDSLGTLATQWIDIDKDSSYDLTGPDEITHFTNQYILQGGNVWKETATKAVYDTNSERFLTKTLSRMDRPATDILDEVHQYQFQGDGTGSNQGGILLKRVTRVIDEDEKQHEIETFRYNAYTGVKLGNYAELQRFLNGLLVARSDLKVGNAFDRFVYDGVERLSEEHRHKPGSYSVVQRSLTYYGSGVTNGYAGQLKSETDYLGNTTTYQYYDGTESWHPGPAGSLKAKINPAGKTTYFRYDIWGRLTHQWGSATYPVKYEYDSNDNNGTFSHLEKMVTYQAEATGGSWTTAPDSGSPYPSDFDNATPQNTTWVYHEDSGLLEKKQDHNGKGLQYTYHSATPLVNKIKRPRISTTTADTTLAYDGVGRVSTRTYSGAAPLADNVTYEYHRDGRLKKVTDGAGIHTFTESESSGAVTHIETITGSGHLSGVTLETAIRADGLKDSVKATKSSTTLSHASYTYYSTRPRIKEVVDEVTASTDKFKARYYYYSNSKRFSSIYLKQNTTNRLWRTHYFDENHRLWKIINTKSGGVVTSHDYVINNLGQRTKATLEDGSYWDYAYNDRGEVDAAVLKDSGGVALPGWNSDYSYDDIGNRDVTGDESMTVAYNSLNQATSVTLGSTYVVKGRAPSPASPTIKVNNTTQVVTNYDAGSYDYFKSDVSNYGSSYDEIEVTSGGDSGTWFKQVPPTSDSPTYDLEGNVTEDWRWEYEWDSEGRLAKMTPTADSVNDGHPNITVEFEYDHLGRRVRKTVKTWGIVTFEDTKFVYDGWNLIAELDALSSDSLVRDYLWGPDLAGVENWQGAGGVGGLLMVRKHAGTDAGNYFVGYDGNGNVSALVDGNTGSINAEYTYDAFGQRCRAYGDAAEGNPVRFSSKFEDKETGLLYPQSA